MMYCTNNKYIKTLHNNNIWGGECKKYKQPGRRLNHILMRHLFTFSSYPLVILIPEIDSGLLLGVVLHLVAVQLPDLTPRVEDADERRVVLRDQYNC